MKQTREVSAFHLLGLKISVEGQEEVAARIITAAESGQQLTVYGINAQYINLAARQSDFHNLLSRADILTPDGMAIVWTARLRGVSMPERVPLSDLVNPILREAAARDLRVFFLGGRPGTVERAIAYFISRFEVQVEGTHGYFDDAQAVIERINAAKPHLLFVGMGAPQQEWWLETHAGSLEVPVRLTCGGMFDFYAGNTIRAPLWMQRTGLEWLFRLIQEPGRLWQRYLLGNPEFLFNVVVRETWRKLGHATPGVASPARMLVEEPGEQP